MDVDYWDQGIYQPSVGEGLEELGFFNSIFRPMLFCSSIYYYGVSRSCNGL